MSGLRRYGRDAEALRVTDAALDAADGFRRRRLPEFIAGAQRLPGDAPTHTPRADPLQAWSAAALPFMVAELLGLHADGPGRCLHVRYPMLPGGVNELELHGVRVAGGTASPRFRRQPDGIQAEVLATADGVRVETA